MQSRHHPFFLAGQHHGLEVEGSVPLVGGTNIREAIKDVSHACSLFSMHVLQSGSCGLRGARGPGGDHHLATTSNGATSNTKNAM